MYILGFAVMMVYVFVVLDMLQPNHSATVSDVPNEPERGDLVQYSFVAEPSEPIFRSPVTPKHSMSSLVDSGCVKSPFDEMPSTSIMDDFDSLLQQLKRLGDMESLVSRPKVEGPDTVPYFPPVTSALRKENRMFNRRQPCCVDYDDDLLPSPQFLPTSAVGRDFTASLADVNSAACLPRQLPQLSDFFEGRSCSQSSPDVSDPYTVANSYAPPASIQHPWTSPNNDRFKGYWVFSFKIINNNNNRPNNNTTVIFSVLSSMAKPHTRVHLGHISEIQSAPVCCCLACSGVLTYYTV